MEHEKRFFPLFVDLSEKRIVVIGGGKIAARRIKALLPFVKKGGITVIAPKAKEELRELERKGTLIYKEKPYEREDLYGADLALAATDDEKVNQEVYSVCKCLGIPVNVASSQEKCDFHFPGLLEYQGVVLGFNGGGRDHGKVKAVRQKVEALLKKDGED